MAKQIGDIKIRGTVAGVTFYKMDGQYYARKKSSLEGKRVKTDPKFRRTMQSAERLARGSQLASRVYRSLPREERVYAWFTELKSRAIGALKEGRSEEEVLRSLESGVGSLESEVGRREQPKVSYAATVPWVPVTGEATRDQRPHKATGPVVKARPAGQSHLWVDAEGKLQASSFKLQAASCKQCPYVRLFPAAGAPVCQRQPDPGSYRVVHIKGAVSGSSTRLWRSRLGGDVEALRNTVQFSFNGYYCTYWPKKQKCKSWKLVVCRLLHFMKRRVVYRFRTKCLDLRAILEFIAKSGSC